MTVLRETFKEISKFYLREARSCLNSGAYRMTIISAATSVHAAGYYMLLVRGIYSEEERMSSFNDVFQKLEEQSIYYIITDDFRWLMNARNAIAHPEESDVLELTIDPSSGLGRLTKKEKIQDLPNIKRKVFVSSMVNNIALLHDLASESIKRAETILKRFGTGYETADVKQWKSHIESQMNRMTGGSTDLEDIHRGTI